MKHSLLLALLVGLTLHAFPADARNKRSQSARARFKLQYPCPATGASKGPCKGYVIEHIKPLACGGVDRPENMQWKSVVAAKTKDEWQHKGCDEKPS